MAGRSDTRSWIFSHMRFQTSQSGLTVTARQPPADIPPRLRGFRAGCWRSRKSTPAGKQPWESAAGPGTTIVQAHPKQAALTRNRPLPEHLALGSARPGHSDECSVRPWASQPLGSTQGRRRPTAVVMRRTRRGLWPPVGRPSTRTDSSSRVSQAAIEDPTSVDWSGWFTAICAVDRLQPVATPGATACAVPLSVAARRRSAGLWPHRRRARRLPSLEAMFRLPRCPVAGRSRCPADASSALA